MNQTGITRLSARGLNDIDDAVVGQSVTGGQAYSGQLGAVMVLNAAQALAASDSAVGTLYGGVYQYVKFKAGTTAANLRGGILYWDDPDNFVVTPDIPTGNPGFAGVGINVVTKGNYGWILVEGKGAVKALANTTKTTPAIGDTVVLSATANQADDLADATAYTGANLKKAVGQWIEAPADASGGGVYLAYIRAVRNAA